MKKKPKIRIVKMTDFSTWVISQPDDRPVKMDSIDGLNEDCGCLMVQYATEVLGAHRIDVRCGFETFGENVNARIDVPIDEVMCDDNWKHIRIFADCKKYFELYLERKKKRGSRRKPQ